MISSVHVADRTSVAGSFLIGVDLYVHLLRLIQFRSDQIGHGRHIVDRTGGKTVDRLRDTLRSVQEEVGYWKARYSKVMEFLDVHRLRERFLEFVGQHKHLRR